ncbi:MAG: hypothetical protein R3B46_00210 [Phycisphaerales bacterium]
MRTRRSQASMVAERQARPLGDEERDFVRTGPLGDVDRIEH